MSTGTLIFMVVVQVTVTVVTAYFFIRVLRTPPKAENQQDEE